MVLIVTFLAFQAADIFYAYAVHLTGPDIIMELFINAVKLVSGAVAVIESHFALTVTVYTPAHTQLRGLKYLIHFLYVAMTALAGYTTHFGMLGMVKVNVVGQIVNLNPLR